MVAGEIVAEGTPSGIKSEQGGHVLEFLTDQPQHAADILKTETDRWRISLFGDRLHVITDEDVETGKAATAAILARNGIRVREAYEESYSLEDVFIAVVEKARQQGKVAVET
jgi:ABC-2 type transport system ATP-binding protein